MVLLASASIESRAFDSLSGALVALVSKTEDEEEDDAATNCRQPSVNDCELSMRLWVVAATSDRAEGLTGRCGASPNDFSCQVTPAKAQSINLPKFCFSRSTIPFTMRRRGATGLIPMIL